MNVRCRFVLELGVFVRGAIISEIKAQAFLRHLDITIEEDKHFTSSDYRILVSGDEVRMAAFLGSVLRLVDIDDLRLA